MTVIISSSTTGHLPYHQQDSSRVSSPSTTGQLPYHHQQDSYPIINNRTVTLQLPYHHQQQDSYPSIINNNRTVIINNSRTFTLSAAAASTSQNLPYHIPVPGPPIGGCSQTVPGLSPPLPASCCVWHSTPEWSRCAACHPQRTCCAPETSTSASHTQPKHSRRSIIVSTCVLKTWTQCCPKTRDCLLH